MIWGYHPSLACQFTNDQWCIVIVSHHWRDLANGDSGF